MRRLDRQPVRSERQERRVLGGGKVLPRRVLLAFSALRPLNRDGRQTHLSQTPCSLTSTLSQVSSGSPAPADPVVREQQLHLLNLVQHLELRGSVT